MNKQIIDDAIKALFNRKEVWVAPERSVDTFVQAFRVEEVSNLLRSGEV